MPRAAKYNYKTLDKSYKRAYNLVSNGGFIGHRGMVKVVIGRLRLKKEIKIYV